MKLLAIETSCDETAITIFDFEKKEKAIENIEFSVLSNHVLSQINIHREFGGVFPALAKREHAKNIVKIFTECLKESGLYKEKINDLETENSGLKKDFENEKNEIKKLLERESEMFDELLELVLKIEKPNIEAIAITSGPGLAPALWVGINFAKALAIFWNIKVYPINHMEGHIVSALISPISEKKYLLKNLKTPALALLISGGHTEINYFEKLGKYKKIGQTVDDAVGEAFDKVARSLNLPYPGGPEISKIAEFGRENNFQLEKDFALPRPMLNSPDLNFSFSGLKTAVIHTIQKMQKVNKEEDFIKKHIALDFENAVTEILLKKIKKAFKETSSESLLIGGGVVANNFIRQNFQKLSQEEKFNLHIPEKFLTGDNAFMIGTVAILKIFQNLPAMAVTQIVANSNWSVEEI